MKNNRKILINIILLISIISIIFLIIIKKNQDNIQENIVENSIEISQINIAINNVENTIIEEQPKIINKENILENYKGYEVCAKLEIPSISLETYVLSNYSKQALNVSVTKFWGVNPNQIGNFCIAGHNFKNPNMFNKLKNIEIGDKLFISDNDNGKIEYEVFKIDIVLPENVSCLDPITENTREVTLITCTTDSMKRIIVKAKEIKE